MKFVSALLSLLCVGAPAVRAEIEGIPEPVFIDIQERLQQAHDYHHPTTLKEYFDSQVGGLHNMILLKWDKDGELHGVSYVNHVEWFPPNGYNAQQQFHPLTPRDLSSQVEPSEYGRVAILYNDDVVAHIDWSITPPIPFLAYTLPSTVWENDMYKLTPTPYDMYGFNRFCITIVDQVTTPYFERKPVIIWRGETHGMSDMNRFLLMRMSDTNRDWLDCQSTLKNPAARMERTEMASYRYQLDIGGESGTTWGGLLWKMCTGDLVFRVETFAKDWWHDLIQPWVHYIPVDELITNLRERYEWVEANPDKAYEIAQNGNKLCREVAEEDFVWNWHQKVLDSIPPATKELAEEMDKILSGEIDDPEWTFTQETDLS